MDYTRIIDFLTSFLLIIVKVVSYPLKFIEYLYNYYFGYIVYNPTNPLAIAIVFAVPLVALYVVKKNKNKKQTKIQEAITATLCFSGLWAGIIWIIGLGSVISR